MSSISILIPVYNGALTIRRAIRSALDQPSVDVEVIVVNDGSTDHTAAMVEPFLSNARVKYIEQPNGGLVGALNTACQHISGDYVIRLDADDWYKRGGLYPLKAAMDGGAGFVYGSVVYHGRRSDTFKPMPYRREDFYRHNASLYPYMFRREALKTCQFRNVCDTVPGLEDYDFVLQLIAAGYEGRALPDVHVLNYLYAYGSMMQQSKDGQTALFAAFRQYWPMVTRETL